MDISAPPHGYRAQTRTALNFKRLINGYAILTSYIYMIFRFGATPLAPRSARGQGGNSANKALCCRRTT